MADRVPTRASNVAHDFTGSGIFTIDGIINPDTISLVPGTVIPKAPNSAGLQPIRAAGNFDVSQFVLNDMRLNIKRALYNEMLGDPN